jgi:tetrahydromethanopterin S-methyltransferase subunit B
MDTDKRGPGRPPIPLEQTREALRADLDALKVRIEALEQIIMALQSALDKPRPTETFSAWNNRLNSQ